MKIAFWLTSMTRVMNQHNWGKVPMGGAEVSAVNLGDELQKLDCDVTYFLQRCEPFDLFNLHVKRHDQIFDSKFDYFICVRPHPVLEQPMSGVKKILWSGDAFDQPSNEIFWNKTISDSMTAFVFKSNWQREKILDKYFYIDKNKAHVMFNGVKDKYLDNLDHIQPQKTRFIHTSTWYRGVKNFAQIFPKILERIPDAEIHVFSKTSLYSENNPKVEGWIPIAEQLCRIPGVILREPVPQWILFQEIKKAWLMLYPNTGFVESSCGSALQATSVGTPVVATKRAGLTETVGEAGLLIDEKDGWQNEFVEKTLELCWNKEKRGLLSRIGSEKAPLQLWSKKATEWLDFLKCL